MSPGTLRDLSNYNIFNEKDFASLSQLPLDLRSPRALQQHFRDATFDAIHLSGFLQTSDSSTLAPGLVGLDDRQYKNLVSGLLKQMRRMLKTGGKAIINDKIYNRRQL